MIRYDDLLARNQSFVDEQQEPKFVTLDVDRESISRLHNIMLDNERKAGREPKESDPLVKFVSGFSHVGKVENIDDIKAGVDFTGLYLRVENDGEIILISVDSIFAMAVLYKQTYDFLSKNYPYLAKRLEKHFLINTGVELNIELKEIYKKLIISTVSHELGHAVLSNEEIEQLTFKRSLDKMRPYLEFIASAIFLSVVPEFFREFSCLFVPGLLVTLNIGRGFRHRFSPIIEKQSPLEKRVIGMQLDPDNIMDLVRSFEITSDGLEISGLIEKEIKEVSRIRKLKLGINNLLVGIFQRRNYIS